MKNITRHDVSSCLSPLSRVPDNVRIYFAIMFGINGLVATTMNVTVLILFTRVRSLHNKSDLHILSLAIGDAIIGLILSPISVVQVSNKNFENCFVYKLGSFLVVFLGISAFILMVIAYDRYIKIRELERYDIFMTKRRFIMLLLFPWVTPLLCVAAKLSGEVIYTFTVLALHVFINVTFVYSYKKIAIVLQERSCLSVANVEVLHKQNEKSFRFIKLLVSIYLSLSSGIAIYRILTAVDMYVPNGIKWYRKNRGIIMATGQLLFQINSVCNPILYFIKHSDIRKECTRFLRKRRASVGIATGINRNRTDKN